MNRRNKLILLFLGLFLTILFLVWLLQQDRPTLSPQEKTEESVPVLEAEDLPATPSVNTEESVARASSAPLNILAKTFAERFGSFSSEADFQNVRDVLPMMTRTFREKTEASLASTPSRREYYGITTRVVSIEIVSFDDSAGTGVVRVSTQRDESVVSPQDSKLTYQDLLLGVVKEGDLWLIDSADWQ